MQKLLVIIISIFLTTFAYAQEKSPKIEKDFVIQKRELTLEDSKEKKVICSQMTFPDGKSFLRVESENVEPLFEKKKADDCKTKLSGIDFKPHKMVKQKFQLIQASSGKIGCSAFMALEKPKVYAINFLDKTDPDESDIHACLLGVLAEEARRGLIREQNKNKIPAGMHKS